MTQANRDPMRALRDAGPQPALAEAAEDTQVGPFQRIAIGRYTEKMTQANMELLDALRVAGVPEDKARAAALSVAASGDMATKADLTALESRLTRWVTLLVLGTNGLLFALLRFTS